MFLPFFFFYFFFCSCDNFAIVIDGGSTGTRSTVFQWSEPNNIRQILSGIEMPPISSFIGNYSGLSEEFRNFLVASSFVIPTSSYSKTTVLFGGTAGMRLIQPSVCEDMIETMKSVLKKFFSFNEQKSSLRVLSGDEEGLFGWISIQYFLKDFSFARLTGALDLGGASTEITFIPQNEQILENKQSIRLFEPEVLDIYSNSFLKRGVNEAYILSKEILMDNIRPPQTKNISHPCLFNGYMDKDTTLGFNFVGDLNSSKCNELILDIFNFNTQCFYPAEVCSGIDGAYLPQVAHGNDSTLFYAFDKFYDILKGLKLEDQGSSIMIQTIVENANQFCDGTLHDYAYALEHSGLKQKKEIAQQCFNTFFGMNLLVYGYKFKPTSKSIKFVNIIGDKSVDWRLGFLLYENEFFPQQIESSVPYKITAILGFILFGVTVLIALFLLIVILLLCFKVKSLMKPHFCT